MYYHEGVYLSNTVFKYDYHPHPAVAVLDKVHQGLVVGLVHVGAVDVQYHVPFPHPGLVGRTLVVHKVHVGYHLHLVVLFVVDSVALQREAVTAVLPLHYDRASPATFVRARF